MIDAAVCSQFTSGEPRVNVTALVELRTVLDRVLAGVGQGACKDISGNGSNRLNKPAVAATLGHDSDKQTPHSTSTQVAIGDAGGHATGSSTRVDNRAGDTAPKCRYKPNN